MHRRVVAELVFNNPFRLFLHLHIAISINTIKWNIQRFFNLYFLRVAKINVCFKIFSNQI